MGEEAQPQKVDRQLDMGSLLALTEQRNSFFESLGGYLFAGTFA